MIKVLTAEEMRSSDEYTINVLGVPEKELMERAGRAVFEEILKTSLRGNTVVVCGKGNNGGDGRVIEKYLKSAGFTVSSVTVEEFNAIDIKDIKIIVDCIFGTGLKREVTGEYKKAIDKINSSGAFIVSCDISSGLNSDNGLVMGVAVKADMTVAIEEFKRGHFLNDGKDYSGKTVKKEIGITVISDKCAYVIDGKDVKDLLDKRLNNSHKGSYGKVAVVGGSKEYLGSALLSANSLTALKSGAGYSYLFVPESLLPLYANKNPEVIVKTLPEKDGKFLFNKDCLKELLNMDALCFGMGVGVSEENYKIIEYLLKNYKGILTIDADGLNSLSKYGVNILKEKECEVVLTPHIKEFSRLSKLDVFKIIADPVSVAKAFSAEYGVTLILKSAVSVITDGNEVFLNVTGNSALAKAGSGDVLSGLVAGLTARGGALKGAKTGAYLLGKAAEFATEKADEYTVTASDVIREISTVIKSLN